MTYPVLSDIMQTIVSRVTAEMGYTVHFQQGHMLEIVDIVKQMSVDQNISHRYPIIALKHDIKQPYKYLVGTEIYCTMYIITLSKADYIAKQRIELIFKPFLYQIRDEFINQIARSGYFEEQSAEEVASKITAYDRLFWGNQLVMGNDGNIFDDWVDAIELDISGLTVMDGCYTQTPTAPINLSFVSDTTGRFIFGRFNKLMSDPEGEELSNISVSVGTSEYGVDSVVFGGCDDMYIFDLGSALITHGAVVSITIPSGIFISDNGVYYAGCTQAEVMNNV